MNCRSDCVVIIVNWGKLSGHDYLCLVAFVIKPLGIFVGQVILKLGPWRCRLSGHSLGAHISGFAGKHVISEGELVERIIGKFYL